MVKYAFNPAGKYVRSSGNALRVSTRNSEVVCAAITGRPLSKAKALLAGMLGKERDLDGRYYTNATTEILSLLKSAENNAEVKGLAAERLIVSASAHQGFTMFRPRRFKNRRQRRKVTHIQLVLQER
jgi:ribosomal protein L22